MFNPKMLLSLFRHLTIKSVKKGELLIQKGSTEKRLFFIRKGLIRSYATNEKMEEVTFQLFAEHHIFGNVHAVVFGEPSRFDFQALEPTKVYTVEHEPFQKMLSKNPHLFDFHRTYLSKIVMKQAFGRVESFVFLSPEERYQKYLQDYPNIIDRAPDKYIAHVLGITPVSLSRIRNRIAKKG